MQLSLFSGTSKPRSLREVEIGNRVGLFYDSLKKGDTFTFKSQSCTVVSKTPKQTRLQIGDKLYTIKRLGNIIYGNNRVENLFRDIEGVLIIDLINELNPFHEPSDIFKRACAQLNQS